MHVHIVLHVDDMAQLTEELTKKNVAFISPQALAVKELLCNQCLMVKDPDGHAVLLAWISTDQSWLTRFGAQAGSAHRK
jgi:extradiol dioxygenase family protein